jgi:enolase-phosphatase E1
VSLPPAAIITDIEGTTTPVAFVHDVLFPYARARLPAFLRDHEARPDVARELAEIARLVPGADPLRALNGWMDGDAKIGPLKALQGMIWQEGYADGALQGALYADVAPVLRRWHSAGVRLFVYSSGSVAAQKLLFRHSVAGDLEGLFSGFFDTGVGGKREAGSYAAIARALGLPAGEIMFLSDVTQELDAAAAAGLRRCQLVRPEDGTVAGVAHPVAVDFTGAAALAAGKADPTPR